MKVQLLKSVFALAIATIAAPALGSCPALAQTASFFCGTAGGNPATLATQQGKNVPVILWAAENYFNESGEDAITRCTRVSGLLNNYRQQGNWEQLINTSVSRTGQPIICAANRQDGSCRLLYEVPKGQSPEQAKQELLRRVNNPNSNVSPIQIN
ncbi:MAG: COP23 domain-containing protein [Actinomycetota bacterium]